MEIIGDRLYVEIPGSHQHELPPLLVRTKPEVHRLDRVMQMAESVVESEHLLPSEHYDLEYDRRRMDLAINLVEEYLRLVLYWGWGNSILEWIRQCEITFESRAELRNLLRPDLWPHAGRSSFVLLLEDKAVRPEGVDLEKAVGLRLTFRQPPPISCFSNQFLFYLKSPVARTAYETWAGMTPPPVASLPPERFTFEVIDISN